MKLDKVVVQVLAMAFAALGLPISSAAAQSSASHPQIDAQLRRLVRSEGPRAKIIGKSVFFGDYDGDGQRDALAFATYYDGEGGNATSHKVAVFRGEKGGFRFVKLAEDVYGVDPRNAVFGRGVIEITTTTQGPNDPRCCPTLVEKHRISTR